jgi:hypothetical protein
MNKIIPLMHSCTLLATTVEFCGTAHSLVGGSENVKEIYTLLYKAKCFSSKHKEKQQMIILD